MTNVPPPHPRTMPPQQAEVLSVVSKMPAEWRRHALMEVTRAKARCKANRGRLLAHPDLAEKLTKAPMNLPDPAMWNGYIPPEHWGGKYGGARNDSGIRAFLVRLMDEVTAAERGGVT